MGLDVWLEELAKGAQSFIALGTCGARFSQHKSARLRLRTNARFGPHACFGDRRLVSSLRRTDRFLPIQKSPRTSWFENQHKSRFQLVYILVLLAAFSGPIMTKRAAIAFAYQPTNRSLKIS